MLVVDPKRRIEWEDLFVHPISTYLEQKMKSEMENTLKESEDISLNMSKFYLKTNIVVDHPNDISKKETINNHAYNVLNKKTAPEFQGNMIKRDSHRTESEITKPSVSHDPDGNNQEQKQKDTIGTEETQREKLIRVFKSNSNKLLHHRNIYVFLASVAEETMSMGQEVKFGDVIGYLLIRKLLERLEWLKVSMDNKKHFEGMEHWELSLIHI